MRNTITTGLLTILLILSGCSVADPNGDLTGSVFIVTSGAGSYKLGLVKVYICDLNDIKPGLDQNQQNYTTNITAAKQECEQAQLEYTQADTALTQATHDTSTAENAVYSVPSGSDSSVQQAKWDAASITMGHAYASSTSAKKKLIQTIANLSEQSEDIAKQCMGLAQQAKFTSVTDADGNFKVRIPKLGNFVAIATTQRTIEGSQVENYYWVVPISLNGQSVGEIQLNNDNELLTGQNGNSVIDCRTPQTSSYNTTASPSSGN